MSLRQLRRVRWAVRAVLTLGVAASVAANILHADPNPIAQAIAAWPPLALLLTVELISRVPVHHRALAFARFAATATIAGIAAWVSYWHMASVAARYGETGAAPYLLPLSVDGLVIVASICLVELGGRIRAAEDPTSGTTAAATPANGPDAYAETEPAPDVDGAQSQAPGPDANWTADQRRTPDRPARTRTSGRRTATIEDARRIADARTADGPLLRDELAAALRRDGLAVSNTVAGEWVRELRDRELVGAGS